MQILLRIVLIVVGVIIAILLLGWIGLQVQPKPFEPFSQETQTMKMVPIPDGLPAPVDRFYHKLYGDQIPVVDSVVITGRASIRPVGPITFPARFRFTHIAGQSYRHYIEATLFGIPIIQVNERYLDGKSLMEMPWGTWDNEPKNNQGANLGMWSESAWFPSLFLTDPRVRWEPLDDNTAVLVVPFEKTQEYYVVRFDPKTSMITYLESMRYHSSESEAKTLWLNESREWGTVNGYPTMKIGSAIWMDDGKPWAVFNVEDIAFNVDVRDYIQAKGQ